MPSARQIVRKQPGQIDAEKIGNLGPIVLCGAAQHRLNEEQRGHREVKPSAGSLRGGQGNRVRRAERYHTLVLTVPSQIIPPAKCRQQKSNSTEQRDQRQHAPHDHRPGRFVGDARLRRPVVRVRIFFAGPLGGRHPSRPIEKCRQLFELKRINDRAGAKALIGVERGKEIPIVRNQLMERRCLSGRRPSSA